MIKESEEFNPKPRLFSDLLCSEEVISQLQCQHVDDVLYSLLLPKVINLPKNT